MKFEGYNVVYTADDEEPDCGICDNQVFDYCCRHCGAEYGWNYYKRKEKENPLAKILRRLSGND